MPNFVLLYSGGSMPESPEEGQKMMQAWMAWYEKMGESITDGGEAFKMSKTVQADGTVVDGSPSVPPATGYTIISAETLDDAVAACADHPHLGYGGSVTVNERMEMNM